MQLESESRPAFLQICSLAVGRELVAVVAEEDEVALVVHGDHSPSVEVRRLWEQGCQHTPNAVTRHRVEVVQDKLR